MCPSADTHSPQENSNFQDSDSSDDLPKPSEPVDTHTQNPDKLTLADKFNARRKRVNDTCNEYTQAIAHTSFNQFEEDVKQAIKEIRKELNENIGYLDVSEIMEIIKAKMGEELCNG